jgi:hypothetical protein
MKWNEGTPPTKWNEMKWNVTSFFQHGMWNENKWNETFWWNFIGFQWKKSDPLMKCNPWNVAFWRKKEKTFVHGGQYDRPSVCEARKPLSLYGHLKYPNNLDQSLNDAAADKIRKYRPDYNNRPPSVVSFIPAMASTSGRLHSEKKKR